MEPKIEYARNGDVHLAYQVVGSGPIDILSTTDYPFAPPLDAFFGEISMIDGRPRAASVMAETSMRCLVLYQDPLRRLLMSEPQVAWPMLESLATRLRGE